MVLVSIRPYAEFGPNYHRKDAPHFIYAALVKGQYNL